MRTYTDVRGFSFKSFLCYQLGFNIYPYYCYKLASYLSIFLTAGLESGGVGGGGGFTCSSPLSSVGLWATDGEASACRVASSWPSRGRSSHPEILPWLFCSHWQMVQFSPCAVLLFIYFFYSFWQKLNITSSYRSQGDPSAALTGFDHD